MKNSKKSTMSTARAIVQIAMLVVIIGGASLRNLLPSDNALVRLWPELQGFCPFGAVQTIFRGMFDASTLLRTDYSNQWVLLGVLAITLLFGAVFCSTLCPLGTVQEWIGKLGKRLLKKRYNPPVPHTVDIILKSLRFFILGALFLSVAGVIAWNLDLINPSYALSHLWTSVVPISAIVVLAVFLLLSLRYERPWCRWFCPYGLILGALGRVSFFTIKRSTDTCIDCKKCDRTCPVHIPVSTKKAVMDSSCNRCMQCVDSCPVPHTLTIATPTWLRTFRIRAMVLPFIVLAVFFVPLGIATAASWYNPTSSHIATTPAQAIEFAPENISPMISLSTLATQAGMETAALADLLGLPADYDFSTLLMDIEEEDEYMDITVRYIREKIGEYLQN
jgi:polyferredoxin